MVAVDMSSTGCETRNLPGSEGDVDHVHMLSENLKSTLLLNADYSDVRLIVEGNSFPAHKIILAVSCCWNFEYAVCFDGVYNVLYLFVGKIRLLPGFTLRGYERVDAG